MPKYIATIVIEANNEKDAEEQLRAEPLKYAQSATVISEQDASQNARQGLTIKTTADMESLSKLSHQALTGRLMELLNSLYGGSYYGRFNEIAKARGRKIESSHFSRMDTASMQVLIETIEKLRNEYNSLELKEARLIAEEVFRVVLENGPVKDDVFMEDVRYFIGRELDLTDATLLKAWETIEQDRMKKEKTGTTGPGDAPQKTLAVKYARIVFENPIPSEMSPEEAAAILQSEIESLLQDHGVLPDDIEIHDKPYMKKA